jgi:hypothetical protein
MRAIQSVSIVVAPSLAERYHDDIILEDEESTTGRPDPLSMVLRANRHAAGGLAQAAHDKRPNAANHRPWHTNDLP